jgi:hypothetical protein
MLFNSYARSDVLRVSRYLSLHQINCGSACSINQPHQLDPRSIYQSIDLHAVQSLLLYSLNNILFGLSIADLQPEIAYLLSNVD